MSIHRLPDEVAETGLCCQPEVDLTKWLEPRDGAANRRRAAMESACYGCPVISACRRWAYAAGFPVSGVVLGGKYFSVTSYGAPPPWDEQGEGYPMPQPPVPDNGRAGRESRRKKRQYKSLTPDEKAARIEQIQARRKVREAR